MGKPTTVVVDLTYEIEKVLKLYGESSDLANSITMAPQQVAVNELSVGTVVKQALLEPSQSFEIDINYVDPNKQFKHDREQPAEISSVLQQMHELHLKYQQRIAAQWLPGNRFDKAGKRMFSHRYVVLGLIERLCEKIAAAKDDTSRQAHLEKYQSFIHRLLSDTNSELIRSSQQDDLTLRSVLTQDLHYLDEIQTRLAARNNSRTFHQLLQELRFVEVIDDVSTATFEALLPMPQSQPLPSGLIFKITENLDLMEFLIASDRVMLSQNLNDSHLRTLLQDERNALVKVDNYEYFVNYFVKPASLHRLIEKLHNETDANEITRLCGLIAQRSKEFSVAALRDTHCAAVKFNDNDKESLKNQFFETVAALFSRMKKMQMQRHLINLLRDSQSKDALNFFAHSETEKFLQDVRSTLSEVTVVLSRLQKNLNEISLLQSNNETFRVWKPRFDHARQHFVTAHKSALAAALKFAEIEHTFVTTTAVAQEPAKIQAFVNTVKQVIGRGVIDSGEEKLMEEFYELAVCTDTPSETTSTSSNSTAPVVDPELIRLRAENLQLRRQNESRQDTIDRQIEEINQLKLAHNTRNDFVRMATSLRLLNKTNLQQLLALSDANVGLELVKKLQALESTLDSKQIEMRSTLSAFEDHAKQAGFSLFKNHGKTGITRSQDFYRHWYTIVRIDNPNTAPISELGIVFNQQFNRVLLETKRDNAARDAAVEQLTRTTLKHLNLITKTLMLRECRKGNFYKHSLKTHLLTYISQLDARTKETPQQFFAAPKEHSSKETKAQFLKIEKDVLLELEQLQAERENNPLGDFQVANQ